MDIAASNELYMKYNDILIEDEEKSSYTYTSDAYADLFRGHCSEGKHARESTPVGVEASAAPTPTFDSQETGSDCKGADNQCIHIHIYIYVYGVVPLKGGQKVRRVRHRS